MKKFKWLLTLILALTLIMPNTAYATEVNTSGSIDEDTESDSADDNSDTPDDTTDNGNDTTDDVDSGDDTESANINSKIMLCDNWQIPKVTYGQKVNIVLPLVNMDDYTITDIIIAPVISTETASFPFEIEKTGYAVELTELLGSAVIADPLERRQEVTYTFTARDDISTGYYSLNFEVIFKNAEGVQETATIETYVNAVGKKGSGNKDNSSVPRVIVTGFDTDPKDVRAGSDFKLTLHVKNTSEDTDVSNLKFDLEAATDDSEDKTGSQAFLPVQGASTIFVENIGKGETKDISIDMNAKAGLAQKPYVLDVKVEYEDESYTQFTSEANVSIPVLQEARFEISDPEVMPSAIEVGSEANIMFSIYNTGKTTMYNTTVKFEGASITGGDTFVGKVEPGETGNVDAMVSGEKATADDGTIKILITYEDESGNPTTVEKTLTLMVNAVSDTSDEFSDELMEFEEEEEGGVNIVLIVVIIIIIAAIVGVILFLKLRKNKLKKKEEDELLADIEDSFDLSEEDNGDEADKIEAEEDTKRNITREDEEDKAEQKEGDDNENS